MSTPATRHHLAIRQPGGPGPNIKGLYICMCGAEFTGHLKFREHQKESYAPLRAEFGSLSGAWAAKELGPRNRRHMSESLTTTHRADYVYVASSWRCMHHAAVIAILKSAGIPHYNFRAPSGGTGFSWGEIMPHFDADDQLADAGEFLAALEHPRSVEGFNADFDALKRADAVVLVLPCGRSAHLELGWAVGAGKRTAILLDPDTEGCVTPELMYKMVDFVTDSVMDLLGWLGVEDDDE